MKVLDKQKLCADISCQRKAKLKVNLCEWSEEFHSETLQLLRHYKVPEFRPPKKKKKL